MDDQWTPVLAELRARFGADTDTGVVEAYLSSQGYNRRQIGEILERRSRDIRSSAGGPPSGREPMVRVQGPHERGRFTPEAWGYLLMLHASGALHHHEFEQLVERALIHVDGRIGLSDIRSMAEDVGVDDGVVAGERPLLH